MSRVEANGLGFEVADEGAGPPVVLLHGFPDTHDLWRHQVAALTGAGFRTIAPDMRGRGGSDRPPEVSDYGLQKIVADVTGIMDALGVDRAHMVGHDWGAAVAWLVAMFAPKRVDHLVVVSVGAPGAAGLPTLEDLQKSWYRILFQTPGVAEDLVQRNDWYLMREMLQGGGEDFEVYKAKLSPPGALTAGINWYRANLPLERLIPTGAGPQFPSVAAPTMGVFGSGDLYLTEAAMINSKSKVSGPWRYECLEGAGHFIPLEAAHQLNTLLLDFLPRP
ncbi:MAG TPA: alpha/beta fold hydrolase [Candidatus Dormibacteraeota bacterium]|jgi:pimeloyl-ACP methyl ester carboxylesterase|nr:alpha/beta fold hydrolase [Candidatus Dormibacteraeota bacterium]